MNTALATARWQIQHQSRSDWVEHYNKSKDRPSRGAVLTVLDTLQPWTYLLELGSHAGVMLKRIHDQWPNASVQGVEVNYEAARESQVPVAFGSFMDWLPKQPRNSWDIVLTHYALAYVSPDDIRSVLYQCSRIAKKALVFAEPTGPERLIFEYPEWSHDYPALLSDMGFKVHIVPLNDTGDYMNAITVAMR